MFNLISAVAQEGTTFLDNLELSVIVVVIGVGTVFIILGLLIALVNILKYINYGLNNWDDMMYFIRKRKSEIKAIENGLAEEKERVIGDLKTALSEKSITKAEFDTKKAEYLAKHNSDLVVAKTQIADINAKYAKVSTSNKAAKAEIKSLKTAEKAKFKSDMSNVDSTEKKSELKLARIAVIDAMNKDIIAIKSNAKSVAEAIMAGTASNDVSTQAVTEVDNNEIIAAITAAIAIVTATEAQTRKVTFKVRSIKEVR